MSKMTRASTQPTTIYFWKINETYGYMSQWLSSTFTETIDASTTITYTTAEQYMMFHKAILFNPPTHPIAQAILAEDNPFSVKKLGRLVPNFDEDTWHKNRDAIVEQANYLKFTQDQELKEKLLSTGDAELVEASPMDKIWGIGFAAKDAPNTRHKWGLNLLGKAIMRVRTRIRREEEERAATAQASQASTVVDDDDFVKV